MKLLTVTEINYGKKIKSQIFTQVVAFYKFSQKYIATTSGYKGKLSIPLYRLPNTFQLILLLLF